MSLTQTLKERFLAGEVLNQSKIAKQYKCSNSILSIVRHQLEEEGYEFRSSTRTRGSRQFVDWQLVMDKQTHSNGLKESAVVENAQVAEVTEVLDKKNGQAPLPVLGQTVTISLLAMSEQGVVSIGIRDGNRSWLCQLTGQTG